MTTEMKNPKLIRLLLSALFTFGVWQLYIKAKEQNLELGLGMVDVVAAARTIPPRRPIEADWLTVKKVPARFVQPGVFREKVDGANAKKIIGKIAGVAIPAGAQLTPAMLRSPQSESAGVSVKLASGQRGYLLRLGNIEIAKLILPGDRIDILATFPVRTKADEKPAKATFTILQNVPVISVGVNIVDSGQPEKQESKEERVLTLALGPLESQRLTHAQVESNGEISIVVRSHGDDRVVALPPVQTAHLAKAPAESPPAETK